PKYLANAKSHLERDNFDRALACYDAAIHCDPASVQARVGRANVLTELGDYFGALRELDWIVRQQPEHARAYAMRGFLRAERAKEGDEAGLEVALADVRKALELSPEEPKAKFARAIINLKKNDYELAIGDLSGVIEHQADPSEALVYRGTIFTMKSEFDRAL